MAFFLTQLCRSITALYSLTGALSGTSCALTTAIIRGTRKTINRIECLPSPRAALLNILILSDNEITASTVASRLAGQQACKERSVLPNSPDFLVCKMPLDGGKEGSEELVTCCLWHLGGLGGSLGSGLGGSVDDNNLGAEFLSLPDAIMIVLEISSFSENEYTGIESLSNSLTMKLRAAPFSGATTLKAVDGEQEDRRISLFFLGDSTALQDEALQKVLDWSAEKGVRVYSVGELELNNSEGLTAEFRSFLRQQGLVRNLKLAVDELRKPLRI